MSISLEREGEEKEEHEVFRESVEMGARAGSGERRKSRHKKADFFHVYESRKAELPFLE